MFAQRLVNGLRRPKRVRKLKQVDEVAEQVKKVLTDEDQKLILMVRG